MIPKQGYINLVLHQYLQPALKNRSNLSDPSLYALLAMNVFLIYHYRQQPDSIHSIIALYWVQSVLIGLFNFLDILTLQKVKEGSWKMNDQKSDSKGCAAFFFLFHYGFFHIGYLIFLAFTGIELKKIDWKFMALAFWIILASQALTFVQHKIRYRNVPGNIGQMFFLPYLRIVPMHLTILVPAFFHISGYMVFLVLKTVFDLIFQVVYHNILYKQDFDLKQTSNY